MSSISAISMKTANEPTAARVLRVSLPREDGRITLHIAPLDEEGNSGKTETYTLSGARYRILGAPIRGALLSGEAFALLSSAATEEAAVGRAVRLLSFGDQSPRALERKLRERGFGREESEAAVARMIARGYIREDEQAYRLAVRAATGKLWGARRILAYLVGRGYTANAVRAAIAAAEEAGDIDFEEIRKTLLSEKLPPDATGEDRRKLLYKHGF